jgi:hypothetical protein
MIHKRRKEEQKTPKNGNKNKFKGKWRYKVTNGRKDKGENKVQSCRKEI